MLMLYGDVRSEPVDVREDAPYEGGLSATSCREACRIMQPLCGIGETLTRAPMRPKILTQVAEALLEGRAGSSSTWH